MWPEGIREVGVGVLFPADRLSRYSENVLSLTLEGRAELTVDCKDGHE